MSTNAEYIFLCISLKTIIFKVVVMIDSKYINHNDNNNDDCNNTIITTEI